MSLKRFFVCALAFVLFTTCFAYAEKPPDLLPFDGDDFEQIAILAPATLGVSSLDPPLPPVEVSSDIASIRQSLDIIVWVFVPFGFALFLVWQFLRWFSDSFIPM